MGGSCHLQPCLPCDEICIKRAVWMMLPGGMGIGMDKENRGKAP